VTFAIASGFMVNNKIFILAIFILLWLTSWECGMKGQNFSYFVEVLPFQRSLGTRQIGFFILSRQKQMNLDME
jgi:hypothetical protein